VPSGLIARLERRGRIEAARDRSRRSGSGRSTATGPWGVPEVRAFAVEDPAIGSRLAGQRGVGIVDLGHAPGRGLHRRWVIAGQVRVIGPREPPPGGLDMRRSGATLDAKDDMGVAFRHAGQCSRRAVAATA
jgi:hypothetical protein